MIYRILMRLAVVLALVPIAGLLLSIATSDGPVQMHPDATGLAIAFGPAAVVAALAWIVKPRQ